MKMLSNTIVAFVPRRPHMATDAGVIALVHNTKSDNIICRWKPNTATGRIDCVWTSAFDTTGEDEAPTYLRLAS